jgi:hypothetical protein
MAYKSHFTARTGTGSGGGGGNSQSSVSYGRVVKVILSPSDPDYKDASMINGVFYRIPKNAADENAPTTLQFAKQGTASIRVIPMEGELVELISAPGTDGVDSKVYYWSRIVNVWNHPHHNANPDTKQTNWEDNLLGGGQEQSTINPLQANPGDTLIEGRLGQSIRFGGSKGASTLGIDSSNDGKPVVLVSNGQITTKDGTALVSEDINKDFNSLYFLSDHKSTLESANNKRDSYDVVPRKSNEYIGNQVLVNGGRLYFNAKEDSIFLSAKESVGINARTLNLDATDYFCVDSKKIYLGKKARTSLGNEPVVLGTQLQSWLETLLDTLENVGTAMSTATAVSGGPVTQLITTGPELKAVVRALKAQMKQFQSKKVFTE